MNAKFHFIRGKRAVEAQFQIEVPDPYPLLKWRTDLGMLVVMSTICSVTYISSSNGVLLTPMLIEMVKTHNLQFFCIK